LKISPFRLQKSKDSHLLCIDSPQRLLFAAKIKTNLNQANLLGRGRFGQVILAKYKDDYAAVKIVRKTSKNNSVNEVNAQNLRHANVVRVLKVEQMEDNMIIVMELWGAINLQQLLSTSTERLPFQDILSYARQLAAALNYCHANKVLHLDVKPANIMVDDKKWIKLGDFGNSITFEQMASGCTQQRIGTVSYCAPEILRGEDPSWESDVYSYGITLWQLQHNQVPFSDLSWPTVVYLVVAKNERPDICKGLSERERRLVDLYRDCWSPKSNERPLPCEIINTLKSL